MPIPAPSDAFLNLNELKLQLNIDADDTTQDDELQTVVDAAQEIVEGLIGPVNQVTVTDYVTGTGIRDLIVLSRCPVLSVTSITPTITGDTTTYDTDVILIDAEAGILRTTDYSTWTAPVTVTYVAGRTVVPVAINLAARIIGAQIWELQYGGGDFQLAEDGAPSTGADGVVPPRARELLAPYRLAPVVA